MFLHPAEPPGLGYHPDIEPASPDGGLATAYTRVKGQKGPIACHPLPPVLLMSLAYVYIELVEMSLMAHSPHTYDSGILPFS